MSRQVRQFCRFRRRGAVAAITAVNGTVLVGFVALTIDVGMLYNVRAEMQRTADAAALAGAWEILIQKQNGASDQTALEEARTQARLFGGMNPVQRQSLLVDENPANALDGDVVLGYLADPTNLQAGLDTSDPSRFNTVMVRTRRNEIRNGPVELLFARIFGINSTSVEALAGASFRDGVVGFKVTSETGNAGLLPFALHVERWNDLVQRGVLWNGTPAGDNFRYDPDTRQVAPGTDNVLEMNLYPGSGDEWNQLPPGNFGTVNIGGWANSTDVLSRQIRYGVTEQDLAYHGGALMLADADGNPLTLTGDTGLSAAIKDDLEFIKGQPRTLPLFNHVSGPGSNAVYRIVAFAGIRVMEVQLTGAMDLKRVTIQPGLAVESSAIVETGSNSSYLVYQPVRLTR